MFTKFNYTATSSNSTTGLQTIGAAPTLFEEIGSYIINLVACVNDNPSSCSVQCSVKVDVLPIDLSPAKNQVTVKHMIGTKPFSLDLL